jgi:porphobilinogen deaminase
MKKGVKIGIIFLAIILVVIGIYFTWFFKYNCDNMECFQAYQEKCSKVTTIRETDTTTWQYTVLRKDEELCVIETKILLVKEGQIDRKMLEETSMECSLPIGSKALPENDLERCHGVLKEEIQQIIIKNAHAQILANIEKVSEELTQQEIAKVIG